MAARVWFSSGGSTGTGPTSITKVVGRIHFLVIVKSKGSRFLCLLAGGFSLLLEAL